MAAYLEVGWWVLSMFSGCNTQSASQPWRKVAYAIDFPAMKNQKGICCVPDPLFNTQASLFTNRKLGLRLTGASAASKFAGRHAQLGQCFGAKDAASCRVPYLFYLRFIYNAFAISPRWF